MSKNQTKSVSAIIGRLDGKTCLITGANSGLGKAMSVELARRGASIIMACRRQYSDAQEEIIRLSGNDRVSLRLLDLGSLHSVNQFCDALLEDGVNLDVAMFNAGMASSSNDASVDGFPLFWQVNYLSNALMTQRFLQDGVIRNKVFHQGRREIKSSSIPRIIYSSSTRHRENLSIEFEHFNSFPDFSLVDVFRYYGLSKLYLMTYAWELGRKLQRAENTEVSVFTFCPGSFRSSIGEDLGFVGNVVMSILPTSPETAAWPGVYMACSPDLEGKTMIYYRKRKQEEPDPRVVDIQNGRRIWEMTEQLLKQI